MDINSDSIVLPLPNNREDYSVKLMVWDGMGTIRPIGKEVFYSKGLILISDIPDILYETWDADIVDMLIDYYFK
ncbi:MAG: hypothetical protein UIM24_03935 [Clostridia bacterium]|nr:hypothetical protein [Clostridia bacterium]